MTDNIQNHQKNMAGDTDNSGQEQHLPAKKQKPYCRRWFVIFTVLLGLLCGLLILILTSGEVQRGLVRISDRLLDSLSIEQVSGDLQSGLVLDNVNFQGQNMSLHMVKAGIQLDSRCLWQANICIQDLKVRDLQIQLESKQEKPVQDNSPISHSYFPFGLLVEHLDLENLHLAINDHQFQLNKLTTSLSLNNSHGLTLKPTFIGNVNFVQQIPNVEKAMSAAIAESEPIDWSSIEAQLTEPVLSKLKHIKMPFELHIQGITGKNWRYQRQQGDKIQRQWDISDFLLQLDVADDGLQLGQLDIQSSLGNLKGQGSFYAQQDFPLNFEFNADVKEIKSGQLLLPASQITLQLLGDLAQQTRLSVKTKGAWDGDLQLDAQLNQAKTPLHLTLKMAQGHYPFTNSPNQIRWYDTNLDLQGNLLAYQANAYGKLEGLLPRASVALQLQGGIDQLKIEHADLSILDGTAQLEGELQWQNGLVWQSKLSADKLNVNAYLPQAFLSGVMQFSGFVKPQDWQLLFAGVNLNGQISGAPFSAQGDLQLSPKTLFKTTGLDLHYANNQLQAKGELSEQSDLTLHVDAPNLSGLYPTLSAEIKGDLALQGNLSLPKIKLDLVGNQIKFANFQLQKLLAKADIAPLQQQVQGRIDLDLSQLRYGELQLEQAKLWAAGSEQKHELHLSSQGKPLAAVVNLFGRFKRDSQSWQIELNQSEIKSQLGNFTHNQNIQIQYDNSLAEASISAHCWHHPELDLCFPQLFRVGKVGDIPFTVKKFDFALLNKWLKQENLTGKFQCQGRVAWLANQPLMSSLQIEGGNFAFAQKINYRQFKLVVPKWTLKTELANNNLSLQSMINLEQGQLQSDIKIQDILQARQLGGSLNLKDINLNILNQLFAEEDRISGNVQSALTLAGSLKAPLLNGNLTIEQIQAELKTLPFNLDNGSLKLSFLGNSSKLKGYLQSEQGSLNLEGESSWQGLDSWKTHLKARSEQFNLDIPNIAKLRLNTDVDLRATPKLLELSGDVDIPWARIEVDSLPESAVSLSSDEVILDKNGRPKKFQQNGATAKSGMQIRSDLKINIGDDVSLSAYGLKTHLNGLLSVRQENGILGLFGQVNLKQGRYTSFGQDLIIRKGQISFSGIASQPFLNIEAIRNPEAMEDSSVVAGVKVVGAAEEPEVRVFSEPSLSQDQALSYLLTGRSLEKSGEAGSSGSVGAALLGLGLSKGGKLVGGIGNAFGISDLNLGTSGVGDSSQVVVSGNITPRLQIKYGVGLFQPLAELTLRYRLLPRLYLQSVSGTNQAIDLLYQFEF